MHSGTNLFQTEEDDGDPDHAKTRELGAGKRFAVQEYAQQKLDGRGRVLQDADHGQGNAPCSRRKHDQRQSGDHARTREKQAGCCSRMQKNARAGDFADEQPAQGQWEKQGRFQSQSFERAKGRFLFDQAIEAERPGQDQGNPGRAAVIHGQIDHSRSGQSHRKPLQWPQTFVQKSHAKQHREQWIDEVTKACFDNIARIHAPDIDEPIHPDEQMSWGGRFAMLLCQRLAMFS